MMHPRNHSAPPTGETAAITGQAGPGADYYTALRHRTKQFVSDGLREGHAFGLAQLEARIAEWPAEWGDSLRALVYGDFTPPHAELDFPYLGISIEPDPVTDSIIKAATCVLRARVTVAEKSVAGVVDAAARMNTFLGVLAALNGGTSGCGWWSHVVHGTTAALVPTFDPNRIKQVVEALEHLPPQVAKKVRSALYWIREPRQLVLEGYRRDVLRVYAGYWNAFECLVEAICLLSPQTKLSREERQLGIDCFVEARSGRLDSAAISECYRLFVEPGLFAKAKHALEVCFPDHCDQHVLECFRIKPEQDRLYSIRNAINHGDVDADNPIELLRVEDRYNRLWVMVAGMLGLLLPVGRPARRTTDDIAAQPDGP